MLRKENFNVDKEHDELFRILENQPVHPSEQFKHILRIRNFLIDIKKNYYEKGFQSSLQINKKEL